MKKVLFLSFLAASLVACNNESNSTTDVKDSMLDKIDSTGEARKDSIEQTTDSLKEKTEATFEKTDSANKVIEDSMKKSK